jgi:hypothetical protein
MIPTALNIPAQSGERSARVGNYTIVPIYQAQGTHSDYGPSVHTPPLAGAVSLKGRLIASLTGQRKTRQLEPAASPLIVRMMPRPTGRLLD